MLLKKILIPFIVQFEDDTIFLPETLTQITFSFETFN